LIGYYGWRTGELTEIQFRMATAAAQSALNAAPWRSSIRSQTAQPVAVGANDRARNGFCGVHEMFGDPWARADTVDPLFPPGLSQPALALPFEADIGWSYTGGPHGAWEHDGALAAVDFAPFTDHGGCDPTPTWVTAAAPGKIVRSERGVVIQDLDGD
jgi:hypothetical protein